MTQECEELSESCKRFLYRRQSSFFGTSFFKHWQGWKNAFSNPHFMKIFFRTALLVFVQETASNQITQSVSLGRKGSREI